MDKVYVEKRSLKSYRKAQLRVNAWAKNLINL